MSTCYSVIARETLVFPPRWKRHLIEDGICKRCLQPEFVKPRTKDRRTVDFLPAPDLGDRQRFRIIDSPEGIS